MRTLVTGGHGFLGSHLVEHLLDEGHEVRAMVSPWGKTHNLAHLEANPRLEIVRGDITEPESLGPVFADMELAYHFAARVLDWGRWAWFEKTNVEGTRNVLEAGERAGLKRFVQVSSVAVHPYSGFRDADPRETQRGGDEMVNYARSKALAEELVEASELETVVVRPGLWPYGPRDPNLHKFLGPLKKGGFPLVAGGRSVINTVSAANLSLGLRLAGTVPAAANRAYVIADAGAPDWRELLSYLAAGVGGPAPKMSLPGWLSLGVSIPVEWMWAVFAPKKEPPLTKYRGGVMNRDVHFSIDQAREELGFEPVESWQEGFDRALAWFKAQG